MKAPELIDQGYTSTCGMADAAMVLACLDAGAYAQAIKDLYLNGSAKVGDYNITPTGWLFQTSVSFNYYKRSGCPAADWILLSSLRDNENKIGYGGHLDKGSENIAGINFPSEVDGILTKMGFQTTSYMNPLVSGGGIHELKLIQSTFSAGTSKIIMLVNYKNMKESTTWSFMSNHYVVYAGGLVIDENQKTAQFKVWTWGGEATVNTTFESFRDNFYGELYIRKK